MFLLLLLFNYYTIFSLLALIGSISVIALIARDALFKRRVVRAGLTSVFVTPVVIALMHLWTTWSWTAMVLSLDFHTESVLYGTRPVILIHLGADLARAFLPASWFPSGVVGGIVGLGCGILVGRGRGRRAPSTTATPSAPFPRRALILGGSAALGLLVLPGVAFALLRSRGAAGIFSSSSPSALTPVPTFSPHPRQVNSVALSPDGSRVAFGGSNGLLQVWDVRHQKLLFTCRSQAGLIEGVSWSPDGKSIASSGGKILTLWDAQSGVLLTTYTFGGPGVDLFPLSWSPDGKSIAASDYWAGKLHVWRVANATLTLLYTCDGTSASWSPNGRYLVTATGLDAPLIAWVRDAHTGKLLFTYQGISQGLGGGGANFSDAMAWSPDSKRIALGVADTVHIWDALDGGHLKQYKAPNVGALVWLPGGEQMVTGDNNGEVKSWNIADGHTAHTYKQIDMNVVSRTWALTSTPNGKYLAAGFLENTVLVWETQSGKQLFQFKAKS